MKKSIWLLYTPTHTTSELDTICGRLDSIWETLEEAVMARIIFGELDWIIDERPLKNGEDL